MSRYLNLKETGVSNKQNLVSRDNHSKDIWLKVEQQAILDKSRKY